MLRNTHQTLTHSPVTILGDNPADTVRKQKASPAKINFGLMTATRLMAAINFTHKALFTVAPYIKILDDDLLTITPTLAPSFAPSVNLTINITQLINNSIIAAVFPTSLPTSAGSTLIEITTQEATWADGLAAVSFFLGFAVIPLIDNYMTTYNMGILLQKYQEALSDYETDKGQNPRPLTWMDQLDHSVTETIKQSFTGDDVETVAYREWLIEIIKKNYTNDLYDKDSLDDLSKTFDVLAQTKSMVLEAFFVALMLVVSGFSSAFVANTYEPLWSGPDKQYSAERIVLGTCLVAASFTPLIMGYPHYFSLLSHQYHEALIKVASFDVKAKAAFDAFHERINRPKNNKKDKAPDTTAGIATKLKIKQCFFYHTGTMEKEALHLSKLNESGQEYKKLQTSFDLTTQALTKLLINTQAQIATQVDELEAVISQIRANLTQLDSAEQVGSTLSHLLDTPITKHTQAHIQDSLLQIGVIRSTSTQEQQNTDKALIAAQQIYPRTQQTQEQIDSLTARLTGHAKQSNALLGIESNLSGYQGKHQTYLDKNDIAQKVQQIRQDLGEAVPDLAGIDPGHANSLEPHVTTLKRMPADFEIVADHLNDHVKGLNNNASLREEVYDLQQDIFYFENKLSQVRV